MKVLSKFVTWGLSVLFMVNIAGVGWYLMLQRDLRLAKPAASLMVGDRFPLMSGVDLKGAEWKPRDAPCRIIRITDDRCKFCRKDAPSYGRILEAARISACEAIEISPLADGMALDPRPGVTQLQYLSENVGSVLFPFVTPQTIIVDRDWQVRMTKRGSFDERSLSGALSLVMQLSASRMVSD